MAKRACLILHGLVVERGNRRRTRIDGQGMALQTQQVDLAALEQARIRGAVRSVAGGTTVDLYDRVFEYEWAGLVGVALETDGVACRCGAKLTRFESAVLVVAIRAFYKALVDPMVEGPGERLLHFQVARVTELRLLLTQQVLRFLGVMRIMAIGTSNIALQMRGASEIRMLRSVFVTAQAARATVFGGHVLEREDLGFVAAAFDVFLTGTVTRLTAVPFGATLCVERCGEVG